MTFTAETTNDFQIERTVWTLTYAEKQATLKTLRANGHQLEVKISAKDGLLGDEIVRILNKCEEEATEVIEEVAEEVKECVDFDEATVESWETELTADAFNVMMGLPADNQAIGKQMTLSQIQTKIAKLEIEQAEYKAEAKKAFAAGDEITLRVAQYSLSATTDLLTDLYATEAKLSLIAN